MTMAQPISSDNMENPESTRALLQAALRGEYGSAAALPAEMERGCEGLSILPSSHAQAQYMHMARDIIRHRMDSGWYAGKLWLINSQDRAAGAALEKAIMEMLRQRGRVDVDFRPDFGSPGPLAAAGVESINVSMLMHMPNGGAVSGTFATHNYNSYMAATMNASICVLMRHPADALTENALRDYALLEPERARPFDAFLAHYLAGDWATIDPASRLETHQSLLKHLHWLSSWMLRAHDEKLCLLLRYEDMQVSSARVLNEFHRGLYGDDATDDLLHGMVSLWETHGSNGPGLWKRYFTPELAAEYNRIAQRFADMSPNMETLRLHYPDLLLDPAQLINAKAS